ncbi:fructose-6-phosphate aldolase [Roseomonas nepalensis]|uniref:Probable transaldolase n=1 Tax=Muricoccus nepalensis TaxID=1854500 RepID=A0A502GBY0_9PROT|nr:fructose-6-phosphate aldolase [Roseomonas nepalensis]TPG58998.1 fructose-6-phosphate aldolase [Roseomonas nepalensis]
MKFFVDTAEVSEIRALAESGLLDGVTTNPSLIAKSGRPMAEVIKEICDITPGPVSAEVTATDYDGMMREGEHLGRIAGNVVIKLPLTEAGLRACKHMVNNGVMVNVTLCFSAAQALLAAKAGATYISPFVGRLDDIGQDGMTLIADTVQIYKNYDAIRTEVLVASIRHPIHLIQAAKMGAHVATLPPSVIKSLYKHPLTDRGLESFLADWKKTGQSIL